MRQTEKDWFQPLWRRVTVTGFVAAWFAFEMFWARDEFWMLITGAALAYAVWSFFIRFEDKSSKPGTGGDDNGKPEA
ncbi:MAG TPA: DUF3329 domain-containing protein [Devosiaceae bacterium]|nr:DUF3329 domain-containing protein [Devosiaceae bacterium]